MTKGELAFLAVKNWCESNGYSVPVAEYFFATAIGRKWRWDISWPELLLAVEVQGAIWKKGGHTTGDGISKDCEKYCTAAAMGWRMMPVTYKQLNSGQLFKWLEVALKAG